jgi:hypothetical protein
VSPDKFGNRDFVRYDELRMNTARRHDRAFKSGKSATSASKYFCQARVSTSSLQLRVTIVDYSSDSSNKAADFSEDSASNALCQAAYESYAIGSTAGSPPSTDGMSDDFALTNCSVSNEIETMEVTSASDSPYENMTQLADLISSNQFMTSDGTLTAQALSKIRGAIEACWRDPADNFFRQGSAGWVQDQLNGIRPAGSPPFRFEYFPGGITSPLMGPDIIHPAILRIQVQNGSGWRTINVTEIDR